MRRTLIFDHTQIELHLFGDDLSMICWDTSLILVLKNIEYTSPSFREIDLLSDLELYLSNRQVHGLVVD
jgi:hypothetical protein